jgi:hypothetical protein
MSLNGLGQTLWRDNNWMMESSEYFKFASDFVFRFGAVPAAVAYVLLW